MQCPDCKGQGEEVALIHDKPCVMKCFRCKGNGNVPDAMAQWIIDGRRLRDMRVNGKPYRNLYEEATRRGKRNPPGQCFIKAGWRECGRTKKGLIILEALPCPHSA